jgi:hypothetical protein
MSEEKKEKENLKGQSAKDVAEAMVANMKANMEDPEFWDKRDRIIEEATEEVLEKRKLRHQQEESDTK